MHKLCYKFLFTVNGFEAANTYVIVSLPLNMYIKKCCSKIKKCCIETKTQKKSVNRLKIRVTV